MSRRLEVIAYAGYRGEQEPRTLVLDGERLGVEEVRHRWREPDGRYFEVRLADGCVFVLRASGGEESWSIVRRPGSSP